MLQLLDGPRWPSDLHVVDAVFRAEAEMDAPAARRCVTHRCSDVVVLHGAGGGCYADDGADCIPVAPAAREQDIKPMLPWAGSIHQQLGRLIERGDDDVHASIVIEIAE